MADEWKPDYEAEYLERAERLKRIREDPSILSGIKEFYKDHPVEFIND